MPLVKIPRAMQKLMKVPTEAVPVSGLFLQDCMESFIAMNPAFKAHWPSNFLNIYVDGEDSRYLSSDKKLDEQTVIEFVSAMSGG